MTTPRTPGTESASHNPNQTDLLALVVHELRAPLTGLLAYVDLLFDPKLTPADRETYLSTIKLAGRQLITQMNDILDFSRIEAEQIQAEQIRVSPFTVVGDVLQSFQELARAKGLSLSAQPIGTIPQTICSDPVRMRQVLFNLVGNAIKFTESGGIVVIIRMVDFNDTTRPLLAIDVIDTGIGPQRIDRLFKPPTPSEQSLRMRVGSMGLGLIMSQRVAQLLGGDLTVTSQVGVGSTFTWTLATGSLEGVPLVHHRDDAAACIQRKLSQSHV